MKDEDFKTLMLASKEVNSAFTSLELYNVAVHVTSTSSAEKLKQIMQMCFDSVETIYLGWNAEKCQTLSGMWQVCSGGLCRMMHMFHTLIDVMLSI